MPKSLVVVESPAKAKTINKFLGRNYTVRSSVGHIRDLPAKKLAVDVQNGFTPEYITIRGKAKVIKEIQAEAKKTDAIYLAADPDREGEAICWHVAETLKSVKKPIYRVTYNEITESAIRAAMENPGEIDQRLVDSQQARRVLDRLVGYQISPILWRNVKSGLSAGRVQSVAVRLICEREAEIEAFVPQEYWTITANLAGKISPPFNARLLQIGSEKGTISTYGFPLMRRGQKQSSKMRKRSRLLSKTSRNRNVNGDLFRHSSRVHYNRKQHANSGSLPNARCRLHSSFMKG